MPRPRNPDFSKDWKIKLPAPLAGAVEVLLFDNVHNKPMYGARGILLENLLEYWVAKQKQEAGVPNVDIPDILNMHEVLNLARSKGE